MYCREIIRIAGLLSRIIERDLDITERLSELWNELSETNHKIMFRLKFRTSISIFSCLKTYFLINH